MIETMDIRVELVPLAYEHGLPEAWNSRLDSDIKIPHHLIEQEAFFKFERRNFEHGFHEQDWYEAEYKLICEFREIVAALSKTPEMKMNPNEFDDEESDIDHCCKNGPILARDGDNGQEASQYGYKEATMPNQTVDVYWPQNRPVLSELSADEVRQQFEKYSTVFVHSETDAIWAASSSQQGELEIQRVLETDLKQNISNFHREALLPNLGLKCGDI